MNNHQYYSYNYDQSYPSTSSSGYQAQPYNYDYGYGPGVDHAPPGIGPQLPPSRNAGEVEVVKSSTDADYTLQWIEYFRSVGEYGKALELEQKMMNFRGPDKITVSVGKESMSTKTMLDAQMAIEKMLTKVQSNNITIKPNEPVVKDLSFSYSLMATAAQGKRGPKLDNWNDAKVRAARKRKAEDELLSDEKPTTQSNEYWLNGGSTVDGVGKKLLQKMGWKPGNTLGKNQNGLVEPLKVEMKMDRRGIYTADDKKITKKEQEVKVNGKHPVCYIQEICDRRKWKYPEFTCTELGPPHSKRFFWKAKFNGEEYSTSCPTVNKKAGKAQVCMLILQHLGLVKLD